MTEDGQSAVDEGPIGNEDVDDRAQTISRSLNILQVNKLYHPVVGGVETVVRDIATGLAERDHVSRVLAATTFGRGGRATMNGVSVSKTTSLGRVQSVPLAPSFPLRLHQAARNADVVHHHVPNPLGPISHHLTPSADAKTVVTYHSDIVRQQDALRFYAPILRSFLDDVDRIVVTSPRLLEHSPFLGPHSEKCTVVPLSIDPTALEYAESNEIDLPVDGDRPTVLFVGRLNYYKGVEFLVDAMETVDASLLIVGDGERRDALEKRARKRGVEQKIAFLGTVSNDTLNRCYEVADLFVLPSVEPSEAFGIVQLEAMAHELPVVNTDLSSGVPWVSPDGETGRTVPPRDSEALANAIQELVDDETLRRRFGQNGRERVLERFTRGRMLDDIEAVYAAVLDESKIG